MYLPQKTIEDIALFLMSVGVGAICFGSLYASFRLFLAIRAHKMTPQPKKRTTLEDFEDLERYSPQMVIIIRDGGEFQLFGPCTQEDVQRAENIFDMKLRPREPPYGMLSDHPSHGIGCLMMYAPDKAFGQMEVIKGNIKARGVRNEEQGQDQAGRAVEHGQEDAEPPSGSGTQPDEGHLRAEGGGSSVPGDGGEVRDRGVREDNGGS